jgi:hypothetical protein
LKVIDFVCIPCVAGGAAQVRAGVLGRLPVAANFPLILRHFLLFTGGFYLDLTAQNKDDIALAFCRVPKRRGLHAVRPMRPERAGCSAHFQQFRIIEGTWFGSLEQQGAS